MATGTLLDKAREYVARGYSVIPIRSGEKVPDASVLPLDENGKPTWKPFQDRRPTDQELVLWFEDGGRNIAIVTGAVSNLNVIDCDSTEAVRHASDLGLGTVPTVKTRRGYHFYYRNAEGTRNFVGKDDLEGIDFRAEGGYVLAPPSVIQGHVYRWEFENAPLLDVPTWAGGYSTKAAASGTSRGTSRTESVDEILENGAQEGARNDSLARVMGRLAGVVPQATATEFGLWLNATRFQPPLPEKEVFSVARSIYSAESRSASLHDHRSDRGIICTLSENAEAPPPAEYFVEDLIPKPDPDDLGCITNLNAPGGTSKSYLALYIAVQLARGADVFGIPTKPARVLILDGEAGSGTFKRRLAGVCRGLGLNTPPSGILHATLAQNVQDKDAWSEIRSLIEEFKPDLIIIDSFNALCVEAGRETSKVANVAPAYRRLKSLRLAILLIDHTGHADKSRPMDSVVKMNDARSVLNLEKKSNGEVVLKCMKTNDGPEVEFRYRMTFSGKDPRTDFAVRFERVEEKSAWEHEPRRTLGDQIIEVFQSGKFPNGASSREVAAAIGHSNPDSVRHALSALQEHGFYLGRGRKWRYDRPSDSGASGYIPTPRVGDIPNSSSGVVS